MTRQPTASTMTDLDYYQWRERIVTGDSGESATSPGDRLVERLLIPCSDPMLHEQPANGIFATVDDAVAYLDDFGFNDAYDPDTWVLVHYVGTIVPVPMKEQR